MKFDLSKLLHSAFAIAAAAPIVIAAVRPAIDAMKSTPSS